MRKSLLLALGSLLLAAPGGTLPRGNLAELDCLSIISLIKAYPPESFELFRALYAHANPRPLGESIEKDNVEFLSLMNGPSASKLVFVHGMLKPLKRLNDAVFADDNSSGKDDVNAARNLFRILLADNLDAHPELSRALVGKFLDFKTSELAFDPSRMKESQHFDAELNHLIRVTQIQFDQAMTIFLRKNPELMQTILQERGLSGDFRGWHLFGVASGHADYAVAAARQAARAFDPEIGMKSLNPNRFRPESLVAPVTEIEQKIKPSLLASLKKDSGVFVKYEKTDHDVLSMDAIDILRKVSAGSFEEYAKQVKADFAARFDGLKLTDEQVKHLRDYFSISDDFQPTVRNPKRTSINLSGANDGVMNVDYAGQNVVNMYHTMGAIAEGGVAIRKAAPKAGAVAVDRAREGEVKATARLHALQTVLDTARLRAGVRGEYQVSGDDGSVVLKGVPSGPVRDQVYREILKGAPPASDYRIVWVPAMRNARRELDTVAIGQESIKGENFEKKLRGKLYGQLPTADLKSVGISLDMDPTSKTYRLIFFGPKAQAEAVSAKAQAVIEASGLSPEGYRLGTVQTIW